MNDSLVPLLDAYQADHWILFAPAPKIILAQIATHHAHI